MKTAAASPALFLLPPMLLFVIFFALGFSSGMIFEGKSSFLLEVRADQALSFGPVIRAMPGRPGEPVPPVAEAGTVDRYDIRQRERAMTGASSMTYGRRLNWGTTATLQALACLFVIAACTGVLVQIFRASRIGHPVLLSLLAVSGIGGSVFLVIVPAQIQGILHELLELTIEQDMAGITRLWDRIDASAFIAAVLLAVTVSVLLLAPAREGIAGQERIRRHLEYLRLLLYAGAVLLVLNVLQFSLLLSWVESHLFAADDVAPAQLADAFKALVSMRSVFLTLVLVAVFAPAAWTVRERARILALNDLKEGATETDAENWLKKKGLSDSPLEFLPRVAALLAPFLAGTIHDLLKELTK